MIASSRAEDYPVVAVAQVGSVETAPKKFVARHLPLVDALAERGVATVALNGAKDYTEEKKFSKYYRFGAQVLRPVAADIIPDAAYDLTGGIARNVPDVAALNPQGIRDIVKSKETQYEALKSELQDYLAQTEVVPAEKPRLLEAISDIQSQQVHVKVSGVDSKKYPTLRGDKTDIAKRIDDYVRQVPPSQTVVVQEYLPEVKAPFHNEFRFSDATEQTHAEQWSELDRELRVHVIDETATTTHGRVGLDSEHGSPHDEWVYFSPESVPRHVTELAVTAAKLLRMTTGESNSYLAVDLTPDGSKIIEINGRNIGTMRSNAERPGAQYTHEVVTNALADKLTNMVQRKVS